MELPVVLVSFMNPSSSSPVQLARRDWLKAAGLGALGLGGVVRASEPRPSVGPSPTPRGVIFMVSDGMSAGVLTLAETYSQLTRNRGTAWCELMRHPQAIHGLMDTASASSLVTDSAAAASAWGSGQRVANGCINHSSEGKDLQPIAAILKAADRRRPTRVGLVTTATVTHATPAGFAANAAARSDEHAIAPQYLNRVDVILGGGSGYFDAAQRPDRVDLAGQFANSGYAVVRDRSQLLATTSEKLLGCFHPGHLPYDIDRRSDPALARSIPTLTDLTAAALERFLASPKPFLLQVEGARIDHAAHLNDIAGLLGEQLAFDDALAWVLAKVRAHPDILVVVTSDHGNSNPGLNGMGPGYQDSTAAFATIARATASHEAILREWAQAPESEPQRLRQLVQQRLGFALQDDELAALVAMRQQQPITEWNHQHEKPEGLLGQFAGNHNGIGWTGTSHTADPTLVTAIGPQAQRFAGWQRNTEVFKHLTELLA